MSTIYAGCAYCSDICGQGTSFSIHRICHPGRWAFPLSVCLSHIDLFMISYPFTVFCALGGFLAFGLVMSEYFLITNTSAYVHHRVTPSKIILRRTWQAHAVGGWDLQRGCHYFRCHPVLWRAQPFDAELAGAVGVHPRHRILQLHQVQVCEVFFITPVLMPFITIVDCIYYTIALPSQ